MGDSRTYNAAVGFLKPNLDAGRTQKLAFIDPSRSLTYGELDGQSTRFANLLRGFGLTQETRIALLLHDTVDYPVCFLGALKAGIIPVLLNTLLSGEAYAYMLTDCRARAIVVQAALLPIVQPILGALPHLTHVIVAGEEAPSFGFRLQTELMGASDVGEAAQTYADETAFWLYSSGSTGAPKGTRHLHSSAMATAKAYAQGVLGITSDDVVFSAAKLFFAYGLGNSLSFPLSVGATTILMPDRPTPASVFATMKRHQPSIFCGVPTLFAAMLAYAEGTPANSSQRLRLCTSAGEALPAEIGKAWKTKFGVDILDGIGSTEMLHIYVSNRPGDIGYGTSGRPVPGYAIKLVDDLGVEVPQGEIGELVVAGPSAAEGYWAQSSKSRATFHGPITRSGDKYTQDPQGRFVFCGRTDEMFKVSGIWVSPFEVESALASHDAVFESAVVPFSDSDGLLKPKAFVVLKGGEVADDALRQRLQEHVKAKSGTWKYPREVVFIDSLPKTATGKIQRYKLRAL